MIDADAPLPVLYRDEHFVAIDKPAGLQVHRSRISDASAFALQQLRDQIGQRVYPVHRLDRPTSGVLIFALSPGAARDLGAQFAAHTAVRRYLAITRGYTEPEGTIDYSLREDASRPLQEAVTHYRRLATIELPIAVGRYSTARYSLVEATLETGRTHQIRKHFAHIFHPLIGDTTYGEGRHNRLFREHFDSHSLLLFAQRLEITHPYSREALSIEAALPNEWSGLFARFGWELPGFGQCAGHALQ